MQSPSIRSQVKESGSVIVDEIADMSNQPSPKNVSIKSGNMEWNVNQSSSGIVEQVANIATSSPVRSPQILSGSMKSFASSKNMSHKSGNLEGNIEDAIKHLEPQGKELSSHVDELTESVKALAKQIDGSQSPALDNIEKISTMSKILTQEANDLRASIKSLSDDIVKTKQNMCMCDKEETVNFPYHLFLIEIIINKIHMKCECFELDCNNLVISATFLGKPPIILYDSSYGKIDNFSKLNAGKSTLFAMTYDKICSLTDFEIVLELTKQPPCSSCVTKICQTHLDFTTQFAELREELCNKWKKEQPNDNILCTTSTPLSKEMYYLSCGSDDHTESIGVIEVTVRMSFLGKEITTALCTSPKPQGTSFLLKQDNGVAMYSCQKVEMDDQGKILLDEDVMSRNENMRNSYRQFENPSPQSSSALFRQPMNPPYRSSNQDEPSKYNEIYTKMNANELKIRVPKSTKLERNDKYNKIQELCSCESTPYNTGEQLQFELPRDLCNPNNTHNQYSSNLKYTYKGCDRSCNPKDNKVISVTPTNCPVPVGMEKVMHPLKDVFILKIGKKLETKDRKTDLEIELVTPKAPSDKIDNNHIAQQCSSSELKAKKAPKAKKEGKGKKKGAKGAKGKPKKGKSKKK